MSDQHGHDQLQPGFVAVGVDGSRAGLQATLWAVDEAVDRDVPLRLLHAIEPVSEGGGSEPETRHAAERAVQEAFAAIESTGKVVKSEAEIIRCDPLDMLMEQSRPAAMVCVGSVGVRRGTRSRLGSTAAVLAASAHCPVAVVPKTAKRPTGSILAVQDEGPADGAVLELSLREARLRRAPLRVLGTCPIGQSCTAAGDTAAVRRLALAQLERRLAVWRHDYPDVEVHPVAGHTGLVNYLTYLHGIADPVQLLVVDPRHPTEVLLAPSGRAALEAAQCTLLVSGRQWWL